MYIIVKKHENSNQAQNIILKVKRQVYLKDESIIFCTSYSFDMLFVSKFEVQLQILRYYYYALQVIQLHYI